MTSSKVRLWLTAAVLTVLVTGCNASFTTAHVNDARLSRDEEGKDTTEVFAPDDTFHVVGELANAPDDTKLKAVWTAVDVEGEDPDTELGDKELTTNGGEFEFRLSNTDDWPEGEYQVEVFIDDKVAETLAFEVSASGESSGGKTEAGEPSTGGDAISNLDDVEQATVQIVAQGSFVDPEVGMQLNAAGSGSGFIIHPDGIAVTNNHVVTGAAILKVHVGGESEERNARVLGVSECSDLAVIDIEGDGYPFLEWHSGAADTGLDVYAAGFPLGDPEFTLTRGIVSKERADGETNWASVDHVIEHDATINPGNSGGPLVDSDGSVVGVNYAGSDETNQYFAISSDEAAEVIEQLREGEDVTSIGVNGTAVTDGEDVSGIWVASVKSGSPADEAGIRGGDIITKLEGLVLSTDGTMADYCDVLRGHDPDDKLRVEVLRYDSQELLEGQLNGRELETTFSFAEELQGDLNANTDSPGTTEGSYAEYTVVEDDSGAIAMKVPEAWDDIDGSAWTKDDEELGVAIMASTDRDEFLNTYTTPGVFFGASRSLATEHDPAGLLEFLADDLGVSGCTFDGRQDYEDPYYTGVFDTYKDCGGEEAGIIVVSAMPEEKDFILFLLIQVSSEADLEALDEIIDTFQVVGDLE